MQTRQTHFEQVPLEAIKQIIDGEIPQKAKPAPALTNNLGTSDEVMLAAAGDRSGGRL